MTLTKTDALICKRHVTIKLALYCHELSLKVNVQSKALNFGLTTRKESKERINKHQIGLSRNRMNCLCRLSTPPHHSGYRAGDFQVLTSYIHHIA